jgi:hypothetical protein
MSEVLDAAIVGNGRVQFIRRTDAIPETVQQSGTVTFHNIGKPAVPGHYEVSFSVAFSVEGVAEPVQNHLLLSVVVPTEDDNASYRDIEARAARLVAPTLRAVADQIGQQVAEFDRQLAAPQTA